MQALASALVYPRRPGQGPAPSARGRGTQPAGATLNGLTDAVVLFDRDTVELANRAADALLGTPRGGWKGTLAGRGRLPGRARSRHSRARLGRSPGDRRSRPRSHRARPARRGRPGRGDRRAQPHDPRSRSPTSRSVRASTTYAATSSPTQATNSRRPPQAYGCSRSPQRPPPTTGTSSRRSRSRDRSRPRAPGCNNSRATCSTCRAWSPPRATLSSRTSARPSRTPRSPTPRRLHARGSTSPSTPRPARE